MSYDGHLCDKYDSIITLAVMDIFDYIKQGALDQIKLILSDAPHLSTQKDARGFTPLIMASYTGHLDIVQYLLETGADINAQDSMGNTALMGICFKGSVDIATLLVNRGADVNLKNVNADTALKFASTYGHQDIVELLLANGAKKS